MDYKFKPFITRIKYIQLIENNVKCSNLNCNVQLDSNNYGDKLNNEIGYKLPNAIFLHTYGEFCNSCSPKAVDTIIKIKENK